MPLFLVILPLLSVVYYQLFKGRVSIVCPQLSFVIYQSSYDFISLAAAFIIITWQRLWLRRHFTAPFYGKIYDRDDATAFSHVLAFLGLRLSLSKPNT